MLKIVFANQKGGVGKTTASLFLAQELMYRGKEVLFVDCDPQCNSTSDYGVETDGKTTLYDMYDNNAPIDKLIHKTERGDIIPCDPNIPEIQSSILTNGGILKLKLRLSEVENDYDYCIMDTGPQLGAMLTSALISANMVVIPIWPDKYSMDGLSGMIKIIEDAKNNANPNLTLGGVLVTKLDMRNSLDKSILDVLPNLEETNGIHAYPIIHTYQKVNDAHQARMTLREAAPGSRILKDYEDFADDIERQAKEWLKN